MVTFFELLSGKVAHTLLEFFLKNYDREFFLAEILRKTKLSKPNTLKSLNKFVKSGILARQERERRIFYRFNISMPFARYLKISYNSCIFYPEILGFSGKAGVFLYGSAAEGTDTYKSDFDLLIVGGIGRRETETLIKRIRNKTKKRISYTLLTNLEWSKLAREDKAFFERAEKTKIRLV